MKVLDLNSKLRQRNAFHDETRQAGINIMQAAQYILDADGIDEALFYINHIKDQLIKMNNEQIKIRKEG